MTAEEKILAVYQTYEDEKDQVRVDEYNLKAKTWNTLKLEKPAIDGRLSVEGHTLFYEDEEYFYSVDMQS